MAKPDELVTSLQSAFECLSIVEAKVTTPEQNQIKGTRLKHA